jgi:hypothetical protein
LSQSGNAAAPGTLGGDDDVQTTTASKVVHYKKYVSL